MSDRAVLLAKKPEAKKENSRLQQNTDYSQRMDSSADRILFLQRTTGNQVVQRLIKSGSLQAKLKIGQPGDIYEQEADQIAQVVTRMPESHLQRAPEKEQAQEEETPAKSQKTPDAKTIRTISAIALAETDPQRTSQQEVAVAWIYYNRWLAGGEEGFHASSAYLNKHKDGLFMIWMTALDDGEYADVTRERAISIDQLNEDIEKFNKEKKTSISLVTTVAGYVEHLALSKKAREIQSKVEAALKEPSKNPYIGWQGQGSREDIDRPDNPWIMVRHYIRLRNNNSKLPAIVKVLPAKQVKNYTIIFNLNEIENYFGKDKPKKVPKLTDDELIKAAQVDQPEIKSWAQTEIQKSSTGAGITQARIVGDSTESNVTSGIEKSIRQMSGQGRELDHGIRYRFEPLFGADFRDVHVHTGHEADLLNRSLQARAFTIGTNIFFRDGEFNPQTSQGNELLAHELTHVVQQNGRTWIHRQTSTPTTPPAKSESKQEEKPFAWAEKAARERLFDVENIKKLEKEQLENLLKSAKLPIEMNISSFTAAEQDKKPDDVLVLKAGSADTGKEEYLRFKSSGLLAVQKIQYPKKGKPIEQKLIFFDATGLQVKAQTTYEAQLEAFRQTEIIEKVKTSDVPIVGGVKLKDLGGKIRIEDWEQWGEGGVATQVAPVFVDFLKGVIEGADNKINYIPSEKTRSPEFRKQFDETKTWLSKQVSQWESLKAQKRELECLKSYQSIPPELIAEPQCIPVQLTEGDIQALANKLAFEARDALCCVIAYFLYLKFTGLEKRSFPDFYAEEVRKGIIVLSQSGGLNFVFGSNIWRTGMQFEEGTKQGKKWTAPVTMDKIERLWDSGVRLAISFQDVGKGEPNHYLLIVRIGRKDEWVNMDHTSTTFERRGGPVKWEKVYLLIYDEKAKIKEMTDEAIRALPPQQSAIVKDAEGG